MRIKKGYEQEYEEYVEKNSDPYGSGVVRYSKRWAELMEAELDEGKALEDIAEEASNQADTEGITGFMYGCAVSALAYYWIAGEELRKWHNLKTQIGTEGEKANEVKGTVLNPAVVQFKAKE